MPSDADLARASCRGDRRAFGELIAQCTPMVCAVAYAATHDRALAEDVAQDTFLAAWRDLATLREPASVRPWLCRIARNLAHKARRSRAHEQLGEGLPAATRELATTRTPFDAMHDAQVERAVGEALAAVPEPYREALVLFYFEQRSAKSVSAALGVSEDVVHKRVSRGRQYLAADLDDLAETALRRPPRRDFAACVLALLPGQTATKGSVMWKLALAPVTASMITTVVLAGTSIATPRAPARQATAATPHADAAAPNAPVRTAMRAPTPPALPAPTECTRVAQHLVAITHITNATTSADRIALTTEHLDALCQRLGWAHSERACLLAANDKAGITFCRDAAEIHAGSRDAEPVPATTALDCQTLGGHVAALMIAALDGTAQDNIEASLISDRDELRDGAREACADDDWPEPMRRCFAAATLMPHIVKCRLAFTAGEL